jgi:hypothetical protein
MRRARWGRTACAKTLRQAEPSSTLSSKEVIVVQQRETANAERSLRGDWSWSLGL